MQKDFKLTSQNNTWYGYFTSFEQAGFTSACSARLHGESDIVPGTLNLALHVGDNSEKVLRNRQKFAEAIGVKAERFTTCAQVHGSKVQVVSEHLIGSGALSFARCCCFMRIVFRCFWPTRKREPSVLLMQAGGERLHRL